MIMINHLNNVDIYLMEISNIALKKKTKRKLPRSLSCFLRYCVNEVSEMAFHIHKKQPRPFSMSQ